MLASYHLFACAVNLFCFHKNFIFVIVVVIVVVVIVVVVIVRPSASARASVSASPFVMCYVLC